MGLFKKAKEKVKKIYDDVVDTGAAFVDLATVGILDVSEGDTSDDFTKLLTAGTDVATLGLTDLNAPETKDDILSAPEDIDEAAELSAKKAEERAKLREKRKGAPGTKQSILTRRNSMDSILG